MSNLTFWRFWSKVNSKKTTTNKWRHTSVFYLNKMFYLSKWKQCTHMIFFTNAYGIKFGILSLIQQMVITEKVSIFEPIIQRVSANPISPPPQKKSFYQVICDKPGGATCIQRVDTTMYDAWTRKEVKRVFFSQPALYTLYSLTVLKTANNGKYFFKTQILCLGYVILTLTKQSQLQDVQNHEKTVK